jgi:hypothetical protein
LLHLRPFLPSLFHISLYLIHPPASWWSFPQFNFEHLFGILSSAMYMT